MTHEDAGGGLKGPDKTHSTDTLTDVHPCFLNDSLACAYLQCWENDLENVISDNSKLPLLEM